MPARSWPSRRSAARTYTAEASANIVGEHAGRASHRTDPTAPFCPGARVAVPARDVGENPNASTDRLLGELIAEVRTVKHNQNNALTKLDAVNQLVEQVREMKAEQDRHDRRLTLLEADKLRREGAVSLVEWVSRHWPFTIILGGLAALVIWANGKIHP